MEEAVFGAKEPGLPCPGAVRWRVGLLVGQPEEADEVPTPMAGHPRQWVQLRSQEPHVNRRSQGEPMTHVTRIVSGGQSGVDRAALDFAIARGIIYGGWCPKGGWAGFRPRPAVLSELLSARQHLVKERVECATPTHAHPVCSGVVSPGTACTVAFAERHSSASHRRYRRVRRRRSISAWLDDGPRSTPTLRVRAIRSARHLSDDVTPTRPNGLIAQSAIGVVKVNPNGKAQWPVARRVLPLRSR
jgi:hypothetical protein